MQASLCNLALITERQRKTAELVLSWAWVCLSSLTWVRANGPSGFEWLEAISHSWVKLPCLHLIHYTSSWFVSKSTSVLPRTFLVASVALAKASGHIRREVAQKPEWWRLVIVVAEGETVVMRSGRQEKGRELNGGCSYLSHFLVYKRKMFSFNLPSHMVSPSAPNPFPISTPCPLPVLMEQNTCHSWVQKRRGKSICNTGPREIVERNRPNPGNWDSEPKPRGLQGGSWNQPVT